MTRNSKILSLLLLILPFSIYSQSELQYCNEINNKKLEKSFEKAADLYLNGELEEAELILAKVVDEEPEFTEAWAIIAELNYSRYKSATNSKAKSNNFSNYIKCLEKIVETCPKYNDYSVNYSLGKIYFDNEDFEQARKYLNQFILNTSKRDANYDDSQNLLKYIEEYQQIVLNPVPFQPIIVEGVSTINDDYLPIISPDGSLAFFTHAFMKKDINSIYGEKFTEEFAVARAVDESGTKFSSGTPLPYPFNMGRNQGASSITIDNSTLYITICEFVSRDYDNCDIYYSVRKSDGWSELTNLGSNINGIYTWESQPSISADGKTLYFSSIRPGNIDFDPDYPTCDIWYSTKNADGTWAKAQNLGQVINTSGNEKSPFIHSDSQTLYFSSDGHKGIGGYDIFFAKYRDNKWTNPINIGYPINTQNNDLGFVVNTQGTKAYFASNKFNGLGGWDIYSFDLYPDARPEKVFLVKGKLIDDNGAVVTEATLEVKNIRTEEVSQGVVDSETGNYAVAVTTDKDKHDDFLMIIKKEDYSYTSALIETSDTTFVKPVEINFEVKPIEKGKAVELRDIYYATASYEIDNKSLAVLDGFAEFLIDNPTVKIEIRGHTDNTGNVQSNMTLSSNRAKSVYDYLISKSISRDRLRYQGYGPNKPIASNKTEEGRAKNRRTEFYILSE